PRPACAASTSARLRPRQGASWSGPRTVTLWTASPAVAGSIVAVTRTASSSRACDCSCACACAHAAATAPSASTAIDPLADLDIVVLDASCPGSRLRAAFALSPVRIATRCRARARGALMQVNARWEAAGTSRRHADGIGRTGAPAGQRRAGGRVRPRRRPAASRARQAITRGFDSGVDPASGGSSQVQKGHCPLPPQEVVHASTARASSLVRSRATGDRPWLNRGPGTGDRRPVITVFADSPDGGRGLARDMRVRWALEEVGEPYDVTPLTFAELRQPAHLVLQPFGQIPTFQGDGVALFESGAIVLHLAERHPGLLPAEPAARA